MSNSFFNNVDTSSDEELEKKEDMSRYTVVDASNLTADPVIESQKYCLLSFMSPEGIMNCKVRAVKFRGAFPTLEEAKKYAEKLEKHDEYFKILAGETGKWLDFDPPITRIEKEVSSNEKYQQILDTQNKQRLEEMNKLAGKYKETIEKKNKGQEMRKKELTKTNAANNVLEKHEREKNGTLNDNLDNGSEQNNNLDDSPVQNSLDSGLDSGLTNSQTSSQTSSQKTKGRDAIFQKQMDKLRKKLQEKKEATSSTSTSTDNINKMKQYVDKKQ